MKKTVTVTMTFDVELDIADERLTPQFIENFESFMFDVGGEPDGIFEHVAYRFVEQSSPKFVEGIGIAEWVDTCMKNPDAVVKYQVRDVYVEAEVK